MFKIASTTAAVLASLLVVAGPAGASQDFRSPDARASATPSALQDYRSPDARTVAADKTSAPTQDLRSPDALPSGTFQASIPTEAVHASSSFAWSYVAIGIAAALILLAGFTLSQRRRRHGLVIGS
jgi:hypothetical protein